MNSKWQIELQAENPDKKNSEQFENLIFGDNFLFCKHFHYFRLQ